MPLAALRANPFSVPELLALARAGSIDQYAAVHGVLYRGMPWTTAHGLEFVCLPKHGRFDGESQDVRVMTDNPAELLIVDEPTLYDRLRAADVTRLTGGAS